MVLDLLLFDVATETLHGEFIAASGRLYEHNMKDGDAGMRRIVRHAFDGKTDEAEGIEVNFLQSGYRTPPVLAAIAHDPSNTAIRASAGRDLDEIDNDASLTSDERRIMALWGMEAFSNPRAIGPTVAYVRAHDLFANPYFAPLKALNYRALIWTGALPAISSLLDLPTNGTQLARANTYTYRTADYAMSTTVAYLPGSFGNQQHVFNVTFDPGVTLFHTHPSVWPKDPPPNGNAPGYWTGSGRLPLSCQEGAVNVSIYDVPQAPGFRRRYALAFTHLYAPLAKFDRVTIDRHHLFAQYKDALIAVTGSAPLERVAADEIVQRGDETMWVTEASSTRVETFEAFMQRVRNSTRFDGRTAHARSGGHMLAASFDGGCSIDGKPLLAQYDRHDSKYAHTSREPARVQIAFNGHSLALDFHRLVRVAH
jgi:hypothetical protein